MSGCAVPPVVIGSDDGMAIFSPLGHAEVPDVEAGVYGPAFDAEGRKLAAKLPRELLGDPQEGGPDDLPALVERAVQRWGVIP